ncbi:MAG: hypothetical protein ACRDPO_30970, partial [Streptosporangiaceae bacterium]
MTTSQDNGVREPAATVPAAAPAAAVPTPTATPAEAEEHIRAVIVTGIGGIHAAIRVDVGVD